MQTHWRLAFMFDAPGGDLGALKAALKRAESAIAAAAAGNGVRKGVAIRDDAPPAGNSESHDTGSWRNVDGAIEVDIANGDIAMVPGICQAMRDVLDQLAVPGSIEVMTGPMYPMVPIRAGGTFLSLAFRRGPGTSVAQFRQWWHDQHAPLAIAVLTIEHMLAYDQVHVDEPASRAAAAALGVPYVDYDAYDNLTFASPEGFAAACSDAAGMARVAEDEVGWIDDPTRRYALMFEV